MRYTIDTEFWEHGHSVDPISIGIVAEDGRELYREFHDFDWGLVQEHARADDPYVHDTPRWLLANVKPHLHPAEHGAWKSNIKADIINFVVDSTPEFWAYFADYDWVVFCQTIGRMIDLPRHWPKYCLDIKQALRHYGADPRRDPTWPKQEGAQHNALEDARHNMVVLRHLNDFYVTANDERNFRITRPTPRPRKKVG